MVGDVKHEIRAREGAGMFILRKRGLRGAGWGRAHHWGLLSEGILSEEKLNLRCRVPMGRTVPC